MYTGTLISDLMDTVERAELSVQARHSRWIAEEVEFHEFFEWQQPVMADTYLAGAA